MWVLSEVYWTKGKTPMKDIYKNESIWLVAIKMVELTLQDVEQKHIYTIKEV